MLAVNISGCTTALSRSRWRRLGQEGKRHVERRKQANRQRAPGDSWNEQRSQVWPSRCRCVVLRRLHYPPLPSGKCRLREIVGSARCSILAQKVLFPALIGSVRQQVMEAEGFVSSGELKELLRPGRGDNRSWLSGGVVVESLGCCVLREGAILAGVGIGQVFHVWNFRLSRDPK